MLFPSPEELETPARRLDGQAGQLRDKETALRGAADDLRRHARNAVRGLGGAGTIALLAAGCGWITDSGGEPMDEDAQRAVVEHNDRIATELAQRWSDLPDVVEAGAQYQWNVESKGLQAAVSCRGCDVDETFERVTDDIWRSRLEDLPSFSVQVWDVRRPEEGRTEIFSAEQDAERLTDSYGRRPVD